MICVAFSDDESSGASGAGTIGTPSLAKRGKKITSYADASEHSDENGKSEGLNNSINGSALATNKGEEVAKELDEDEGDDGAHKDKNDDNDDGEDNDYQDDNNDNVEKDVDYDKSDKDNKDEEDEDDKDKDEEDDVEDTDEIAEDEYVLSPASQASPIIVKKWLC